MVKDLSEANMETTSLLEGAWDAGIAATSFGRGDATRQLDCEARGRGPVGQ